jgi:hypothetical protein
MAWVAPRDECGRIGNARERCAGQHCVESRHPFLRASNPRNPALGQHADRCRGEIQVDVRDAWWHPLHAERCVPFPTSAVRHSLSPGWASSLGTQGLREMAGTTGGRNGPCTNGIAPPVKRTGNTLYRSMSAVGTSKCPLCRNAGRYANQSLAC